MQEVENKFIGKEGYNCFGCAPHNESGLKLKFYIENDNFISIWQPDSKFIGYENVTHGGIQATIIDETAAWAVDYLHDKTVVTINLNVNYHKPLLINKGEIKTCAKVIKIDDKHAEVNVEIFREDNEVATSARVLFRIIPERLAAKMIKK